MEDSVKKAVREGMSLDDILNTVYKAAIDEALKINYGNQTAAARQLNMNRGVFRKYMLQAKDRA